MKQLLLVLICSISVMVHAQDASQQISDSSQVTTEIDPSLDPNSLPLDPAIPAVATIVPPPASTDQAAATENAQSQALQQAETNATQSQGGN